MNDKIRPPRDAVDLHSIHAEDFDSGYATDHRFRDRYGVWLDAIATHSNTASAALDLGCGSGRLLLPLARHNRRVVGVDGSAEMLALCERKLAQSGLRNVTLIRGDIARLDDLQLGSFELIVASSVLEYMKDLDGTIDAIGRLLAPGGTLIVSLPNGSSLYRKLEPLLYRLFGRPGYYPFVVNVLTSGDATARLERHGLRVGATRTLSPTPVLSRLLRPLGLGRYSDNLVLYVCRSGAVGAAL